MNTTRWKWFSVTGIHALLDGDNLTGFRVRAAHCGILVLAALIIQRWRGKE